MRHVKLTGREASIIRAIGFGEPMVGAEILDFTRMEADDITDALNGLISAGFVESIPYSEQVQIAEMPTISFEVNPAYVGDLRTAMSYR
ncbi:MAG: MarR family transcriptional regulator [Verrucomicrobiota bacterium]|nr:MarR family transcriptional regulator [Verrucomicrobiota bacterium]